MYRGVESVAKKNSKENAVVVSSKGLRVVIPVSKGHWTKEVSFECAVRRGGAGANV